MPGKTQSGARFFNIFKSNWWRGLVSNQRRRKPTDLQSVPFSHSGTSPSALWALGQLSQAPRKSGAPRRGGGADSALYGEWGPMCQLQSPYPALIRSRATTRGHNELPQRVPRWWGGRKHSGPRGPRKRPRFSFWARSFHRSLGLEYRAFCFGAQDQRNHGHNGAKDGAVEHRRGEAEATING